MFTVFRAHCLEASLHPLRCTRTRPLCTVTSSAESRKTTWLLRKCILERRHSAAWAAFRDLMNTHTATADHYAVMIRTFENDISGARNFLQNMCDRGIPPNEKCYGELLEVCSAAKDMDSMKLVLEEMRLRSLTPNIYILNTALKICKNAGDRAAMDAILEGMAILGVQPTHHTYNLFISAAAAVKNTEEIKEIISTMTSTGVSPNLVTYDVAIKAFREAGDEETVRLLLAALQLA